MITHTPLVAGNLHIKTFVARRWPTSTCTYYVLYLAYTIIQVNLNIQKVPGVHAFTNMYQSTTIVLAPYPLNRLLSFYPLDESPE